MFDPFKPANPSIPGVPAQIPAAKKPAPVKAAPDSAAVAAPVAEPAKPAVRGYQRPSSRSTPVELPQTSRPAAPPPPAPAPSVDRTRQMIAIAVCLIACAIIAGMAIAWKLHQPSQASVAAASSSADSVPALAPDLPDQLKTDANLPVAPGVVATAAELEKPWSSRAFTYRDPVTGQQVPALVVHLPRGGYWGISMIEPFGTCQLEYVTSLDRLRTVYDFEADHPMVGDPCNHAVFDLMQYGDISTAEVRGALVHGMGVRPPLAIEIEQHGNQILAVKME